MTGPLIIGTLVGCVIGLLTWTARKGRPTFHPDDGTILFRHSVVFRGIAVILAFVVPVGFVILAVTSKVQPKEPWLVPGMCAIFFAIGFAIWWEASRFALIISTEGLDCRSPWRGKQFIAWDEVKQISYKSNCSCFVIKTTTGRSFRVPLFVSGIPEFLAQCELYLPPAILAKAKHGYASVGRPFPGV